MLRCVLFDLDGVIRHFDPGHPAAIEHRHGLAAGSAVRTAFRAELLASVVTGRRSRAEWVAIVGRELANPVAAAELLSDRGTVDEAMVALITELRARGLVCALLTNGTDTIPDELAALGLDDVLDHVFNTAIIGTAKPEPEPFLHVCRALDLAPPEIFFTDDRPENTEAAAALGMTAHTFTGVDGLRAALDGAFPAR
ncbi:MAG: HAD-IA family hydrolase [Actinomycetota bacterium]